jgi:hypothetical protein
MPARTRLAMRVMGDTALRISELLLPRPWYIADYGARRF